MTEFAAAVLLAVIALGAAGYSAWVHARFRKPYHAWFAVSWLLYAVRVGVIIGFLRTNNNAWLFWHQVLTGWTAVGFLAASLSVSRGVTWHRLYLLAAAFPIVWSAIAIYGLANFLWAVVPAILFLSIATLETGRSFWHHARRTGSPGAWVLAIAFGLWALHHLDYPLLRARGAWVPWGYYLDILFILLVMGGLTLLVIDDLRRGVQALVGLSANVQHAAGPTAVVTALLEQPLRLRGVSGTALWSTAESRLIDAAGKAQSWTANGVPAALAPLLTEAATSARSVSTAVRSVRGAERFAAALPIWRDDRVSDVLVLLGDVRDPFSALDESYLRALGTQVGEALRRAELSTELESRTAALAQLSERLVAEHEEERKRLARELHDESGQLFSAMRMELGALQDVPAASGVASRLDALVTAALSSLRRITAALRPSLLDDLGLVSAVRSLVSQVDRDGHVRATLDVPDTLPTLTRAQELVLFRAVQEGITNVLRHAQARELVVTIVARAEQVEVRVDDDGHGPPTPAWLAQQQRAGHVGLVGMRERLAPLGGSVRLDPSPRGGAQLYVVLPLRRVQAA
jgi:signal transduction histidine kinase